MNRRNFLLAGAAGALVPFAPRPAAAVSHIDKSRLGYFTDVEVITHEGKKVRFYDDLVKGKIVLFNFIYTSCADICPGMTQNLVEVQSMLGDRVGRDIFMYSLTLEPEQDTPERLKAYAETFNVGPGWLFLTGAPGNLELLRRRLGFVDPEPELDADPDQHTGILRFGNEPIDRWSAVPALSDPEFIVEAIHRVERHHHA
jgi:protein SCO1/2